jgi:Tol biopolymer transport system component/DNA-binding winged helix-turn-helix (wHTH) protein
MEHTLAAERVRFGLFEADLHTGELWKSGHRVKLQSQPFRVLAALLERPGEVISRDELQTMLWGRQLAGDLDQSLGTAINKVREALGDSADNPRFVETLARRGYRFIAPVTPIKAANDDIPVAEPAKAPVSPLTISAPAMAPSVPDLRAVTLVPAEAGPATPLQPRRKPWFTGVALMLVVAMAAAAGYFLALNRVPGVPRIERLTHTQRIAPGIQAMESLPASVTDGLRIFTSVISNGRPVFAQVDVHSGAVQRFALPSEIASPMLGDLSPDGANLLLRSHLSPESEQPVWVVPTSGGSALRLSNIVAHDATWMPDGRAVLYAAGNQLFLYQMGDGTTTAFASLPGRAFWMRWSPDGQLMRFTLLDPVDHTAGLWQVGRDGRGARPILSGWTQPSSVCCGMWTGDGRYFVFQANMNGESDLWKLDRTNTSGPTRITNGPLSFEAPTTVRTGHRIYFLGLESQSSLMQFDPVRKVFVPAPEFLSEANRIQYSRDLESVIWTDQQGRLWRARTDGSERIQVTPDTLEVFLARWSPDGRQIALMARQPGKAWQIYTVPPDGGTPSLLFPENRNQADPTWSADGRRLAFGRITDLMGKEEGARDLQMLDLHTGKATTVPQSGGLFSPRWSPDGRYLAAITLDQRRLMLLDLATMQWKTVSETTVADPVWSADSRFIYYHAAQAERQPIYRVAIPSGALEQIADLSSFVNGEIADYFFCGLTADGRPIVRSRSGTGDVYTIDLDGDARSR